MSRVDSPVPRQAALVVDDDAALQTFFHALLERDGYSVQSAANGRQAVELLRSGSYSVILLDLMMPEVNGFELLEKLQQESPELLRRVIVMSGASQRLVDSLDQSRVWGLLRKPFDLEDMRQSVRSCASGKPRRGTA